MGVLIGLEARWTCDGCECVMVSAVDLKLEPGKQGYEPQPPEGWDSSAYGMGLLCEDCLVELGKFQAEQRARREAFVARLRARR